MLTKWKLQMKTVYNCIHNPKIPVKIMETHIYMYKKKEWSNISLGFENTILNNFNPFLCPFNPIVNVIFQSSI